MQGTLLNTYMPFLLLTFTVALEGSIISVTNKQTVAQRRNWLKVLLESGGVETAFETWPFDVRALVFNL